MFITLEVFDFLCVLSVIALEVFGLFLCIFSVVCFCFPIVKINNETVRNPFVRAIVGPLLACVLLPIGVFLLPFAIVLVFVVMVGKVFGVFK